MKKSRTRLRVKGLNQERAINNVVKNVKIFNFSRHKHDESDFEVEFGKSKLTKKLLEEEGLNVEIISHHGLASKLKDGIKRYGIIAALVICSLFYCLQYNFVLKIDVFGIDDEGQSRISQFVDENLSSRYKGKINTKKLEVLIKDNFEEISSVSIAIVGQSLIVNLNEAVLPDEMKEGNEIVSKFDGLITDINLVQGTLAVDVGDIVKKGDVLVYPYIIDSQGEQREVTPKADIFADVWLSESETFYDFYITTERTGKSFTMSEIYIGKLLLYSNSSQLPFTQYEQQSSIKAISKNNIFPLYRKKTTFYETVTKEVRQDFDEMKDKIVEKAREKTLIFLQENEIIKEENYTLQEGGGIHQIDYIITVNRNIGG